MLFNANYDRSEFLRILQTKICPDFVQDIRPLECSRQTKFVKDGIFQLGTIKFSDDEVSVLEIKQISGKDPRVTLTKDAFKLLNDHQRGNALVAFRCDNAQTWRLSLLTSKYEGWDKINSNPKRYSFLLGEGEKTKTPEKYLIDKGVIKSFQELINRFDVEVVRKEFFKLYTNLFLELYGEIQNNPTFHVMIQLNKIEPVSFAKNLMGKMIFLYFIQKKGWLGISDKDKPFGEGDRDFFKNNFEKLAHDADLFQKRMNFYNDFLEPLFYSGLNKKNIEDWHPELKMKVPYLNGGLFQEEYDRKNTIINLDNEIFKNIIRSFDTYNFTIDEDDAHDREIAVDPEMLGKIFESMISVSKDNIDQIMEVYREAKDKKKITHPNPETILNIDIGKEINKKFGAFYTPREIVHYMTKESLISHLITKLHEKNNQENEEEIEKIIRKLFEYKDKHLTKQEIESEKADGYELLKKYVFDIQESLKSLKILDPAVGSGAFPMGILQEILGLRRYLIDTFDLKLESDFEIKKQIVKDSIYGVDIDPGAIDIARLRFRLSLIVDATEPVPLPNLDFKFVCANSLIPLEGGSLFTKQDVIDELARLRLEYFVCSDLNQKEILKKKFNSLQLELSGFGSKMRNDFKTTREWKKYIEELVKQNTDSRNRQIMERDPFDTNISNPWFDSQMVFGIEGFDIIIGNPPYIKERGNAKFFDPVNKSSFGKSFHQGKMDFWYYFLHKGIDLANKNGYIIFITNSYRLKSDGSSKLIDRIKDNLVINRVVDFHDFPIFQEVSGKHMIHGYVKRLTNENDETLFIDITKEDFEKMMINNNKGVKLKTKDLIKNQKIYIQTNNDLFGGENLIKLGNLYDVSQGVVEASDKISKKALEKYGGEYSIGDGIFVLSRKELDSLNLSSTEKIVVKKYLNTNEVCKYGIKFSEEYLLYMNKEACNKAKSLEYKNIKYHLDNLQTFITSSNKPYGLHRTREQKFFEQPKLICKGMFKFPEFTFDDSGYYVGMSFSVIIQKDKDYNLKYLLAILNSQLGGYRFNQNGKKRGVGVDIGVGVFREFPIKIISTEEQQPFIDLVDQILTIKKQNPQTDTRELEKKIDQMVYELYGLKEEEIKIVGDSTQK